jgi:hypothetical protein
MLLAARKIRRTQAQERGTPDPLCCLRALCKAATGSPRLALLGSGPDRPLLVPFKSGFRTLGIGDGQDETHFARRAPIGNNCFAAAQMTAPVSCSAGTSAGPNGPPDGLPRGRSQFQRVSTR